MYNLMPILQYEHCMYISCCAMASIVVIKMAQQTNIYALICLFGRFNFQYCNTCKFPDSIDIKKLKVFLGVY